jgi:hypothetical protein
MDEHAPHPALREDFVHDLRAVGPGTVYREFALTLRSNLTVHVITPQAGIVATNAEPPRRSRTADRGGG